MMMMMMMTDWRARRTAGYSEIKDETHYLWSDCGTVLINCGILSPLRLDWPAL